MGGEAVTADICAKLHEELCTKLAAHDERGKNIEAQLSIIVKAQSCQAESLANQAASQEKTQQHLESASEALELAAKTVAANSEWQAWAQKTITGSQTHIFKENWKLITAVVGLLMLLAGLKSYGVLP